MIHTSISLTTFFDDFTIDDDNDSHYFSYQKEGPYSEEKGRGYFFTINNRPFIKNVRQGLSSVP